MCTSDKIYNRLVLIVAVTTIIAFPLGLISVYFSQNMQNQCNNEHPMGLDVAKYLLGSGVTHIFLVVAVSIIAILYKKYKKGSLIALLTLAISKIVFGIVWASLGGAILIDYNMQCIEKGSIPVIYALVQWCFSMILVVFSTVSLLTFPVYNPEIKKIQLP